MPVELSCEYLDSPLGIDVAEPRLSWKLKPVKDADRGQRQGAYQILVATSSELLDKDRGDLWDSGMVESDQSVHVPCKGKSLQSSMECYWKVRVKDEKGVMSEWSKPSRWTMGLLQRSDWKGRWIGCDRIFERKSGWPPPDNTIADPWFRKTFTLNAAPQRAVICIASIGYHELYVNGKSKRLVTDDPSWGDMLNRGATTMWEAWDGRNSLMHSSFLYVGAWFIEVLGGITVGEQGGFKEFVIRPYIANSDSLTWAKTQYESNYGTIRSAWRTADGQIRLNVTVPANTSATVYMPASDSESITENGRLLSEAEGVKRLSDQDGCVVLRVAPGRYEFKAKSAVSR